MENKLEIKPAGLGLPLKVQNDKVASTVSPARLKRRSKSVPDLRNHKYAKYSMEQRTPRKTGTKVNESHLYNYPKKKFYGQI